jgi:hypothetical protein
MNCNCPPGYTAVGSNCNKTTVIVNVECPPGCSLVLESNGNARCSCNDIQEPIRTPIKTPVDFDDTTFFNPLNWTIAYKPTEGRWISYYSFVPDYYINHQQYFQQGSNYGIDGGKLWSHLLGNTSYQVLNGRIEPFVIEYVNPSQGAAKLLESISVEVEGRRWQNEYDYAVKKGIGFNKVNIYNSTNNSGVLNLFEQKTLRDTRDYPKTNSSNNTQDILYSSLDRNHSFNYFYNRVIDQENNVPQFLWDAVMVTKEVNPKAVSFKGKRVLERLRGDYFFVRLINDVESRYQISLNKAINTEIVE